MGDRGINMNKRCDMVEAIDRIYHIVPNGSWPAAVFHFLKRPAALDFMADYMAETGKPLGESVLILLAAMRYIDNSQVAESGLPSILEEPMALTNLDLFLVRHHAELFHLCRSRHVQANLFERAFPVMEMLAERYPDQEVVVIELGCSFGMLGRALCAAETVMARFDQLCEPGQQRPVVYKPAAAYRGLDLWVPDAAWLLACIPLADSRQRTARFIQEIPVPPQFRISQGSAMEFAALPEMADIPPGLVPVVLTSFMLYQLSPELRQTLSGVIRDFVAACGGCWVNLDLRPRQGNYDFFVELDGQERIKLENDLCRHWNWC